MRHIVKVGLAVVRERRILMVRKKSGTSFILPGGKPKQGEGDRETLVRELCEEIACKLREASYLGDFTAPAADLADTIVTVRLWKGEIEGEPGPRAEIEELRWIDMASPEVLVAPSLSGKILPFLLLDARREGGSFNFDVFEQAVDLMAQWLARFRDERAEVTENDRLLAGHLAGALAANDLLATNTHPSALKGAAAARQRSGGLK